MNFPERIKNYKDEHDLAEIDKEALRNFICALKELCAVMKDAAMFWEYIKTQCEVLAKEDVKRQVEQAINMFDKKKHLKIWTSAPFKETAIICYAKWVALEGVSNIYMEQIKKKTKENVYKYLTENPKEEGLQNSSD